MTYYLVVQNMLQITLHLHNIFKGKVNAQYCANQTIKTRQVMTKTTRFPVFYFWPKAV